MNETELKVVLLVTRKTLGWFDPMTKQRKEQDYISQSQFMEFTGQSNRAIATAIQSCVMRGWIVAKNRMGELCNTPEKRARRKIWYQLGTVFINKVSSEESSQVKKSGEHFSKSGEHNDTHLVNNVHSTKETLTKETNTKEREGEAKQALQLQINPFLDKFKEINPSYKKLFANKTERAAMARLLEEHGEKKVRWLLEVLPQTLGMKYAPVITRPLQLENKLGELIIFLKKEKLNQKPNIVVL